MKNLSIFAILIMVLLTSSILNGQVNSIVKGSNYIFIFHVSDYNSKLSDAVEYIFKDVIKPEDQLTIFSPVKPYSFSKKTRSSQSKEKLIELTKNVLKKDIELGMSNYKEILIQMKQLVVGIGAGLGITNESGPGAFPLGLKANLVSYRQLLDEMRNLRKLNENLFLKIAEKLKNLKEKNYIYIIYQKELRIIPGHVVMETLRNNKDIGFDAMEVFRQDENKEFINIKKVSKALNESAITLNFLYIKANEKRLSGTELKEFSGDVYSIFSKLAKATGGVVCATSNPRAALKKTIKK